LVGWVPIAHRVFVGRGEVLGGLDAALSAAGDGCGSFVVVHGEAGIGKTSTVAEFARTAEQDGAAVLWVSCEAESAERSFGPWLEALARYVGSLEGGQARQLPGPRGSVLAELVPELRSALQDADPPAAPACASARALLCEAVVWLLNSATGLPILVFDDVQWADADALDLLTYVARHAARVLIVATYLGKELDLGAPQAARMAEIARARRCEYLLLDGLSWTEARELLERVTSTSLDARLIDAMHERSGGNPFFLAELARHLSRHGLPTTGDWGLPESVRQAVALRLAGLSAPARQALDFASVFSAGFSFTELQLLIGIEEDLLLDSLDETIAAEFLRPAGGDRYDFAHALVREVLYTRFSPSRRARLHRRLAAVLERTVAGSPER
jgi:predicted ATPase